MSSRPKGTLIPIRRLAGAPREMSDQALVAACAVGDAPALGALFDRHHMAVYRFLARVTRGADDQLDDLVQSTFIEVWRSSPRYRGKGSALSWIFGIAANISRHHVRGEVRRRVVLERVASCPHPGPARPDDIATRRELIDRLHEALQHLPHDLRVAFVMCELEGTSGVDAARALGVRKGTMWRRLHEARKALRKALEGTPV